MTTPLKSGLYITFEGCECSGKSTQLALLAQRLAAEGFPLVQTKQPGGTEVGAEIRATLLKQGRLQPMDAVTESLLFWADRNEHYTKLIKPALARAELVLGDRDFDSSWAYQHFARGINEEWMRAVHRAVIGDFKPHLTLLYDAPIDAILPRILDRNARLGIESRFDDEPGDFHAKVRHGFLELAKREPERFVVVNAYRPDLCAEDAIKMIAEETYERVKPLLEQYQRKNNL